MSDTSRRLFVSTVFGIGAIAFIAGVPPASGATQSPRFFKFGHAAAIPGPSGGDVGEDMAVDKDGNVFVAGSHSGLDLDGDGKVETLAFGGTDPVVMKLTPGGEHAVWVSTAAGPGSFDAAIGVAPDGEGGAWAVGRMNGEAMRFSDAIKIRTRGKTDGFLVHYDAAGTPLVALAIGGDSVDVVDEVAVDRAGNVFVDGTVRGPVDIDRDGRSDITASTEGSMLLAAFDPHGKLFWARAMANRGRSRHQGLVVSGDGAIFVSGYYQGGAIDFDGDGKPDLGASIAQQQGFLARYDSTGQLSWVRPAAGAVLGRLALTSNGDALALGLVKSAADLDGDGRPDVVAQAGDQRFFLARYRSNGDLAWVRPFAGGTSIDVAAYGDPIAIGGLFESSLDLDGDGSIDAVGDADGNSDGFLAILADSGELEEIWAIAGISYDQVRALAFSPGGASIYLTGFLQRTADFDDDGVPEGDIKCDSYGDVFVARYDCTLELDVELKDKATGAGLLAAGATGTVISGSYRTTMYPDLNRLVARVDQPGIYTVEIWKSGYQSWKRDGVEVKATDCSFQPKRIDADLTATRVSH